MAFNVRRVVTGHDSNGRAVVLLDETVSNTTTNRPGATWSPVWSTQGFPVNNDDTGDLSGQSSGTTLANGTVFRVIEFGPGVAPRNHRTDSVDYGVVISGEIDMVLDGVSVHLRAGDVFVQRGTVHNWINDTDKPCVIAFTLISANPVTVGGKVLAAHG